MNFERIFSYHVAIWINAFFVAVNGTMALRDAWHGASLVAVWCGLAACANGILVWVTTWQEQRKRVDYAIRESYAEEQAADTKIKQMMITAIEATGDIGAVMQVGGTRARKTTAH